jgi:hypothetical protein
VGLVGAEGAGEGAPQHSWAAAAGSSRSGEGAARSGLHACRVCRVGARQGTGVVGEASEGTSEMSRDGSHGEPAAEPGAGRSVLAQGGARRP